MIILSQAGKDLWSKFGGPAKQWCIEHGIDPFATYQIEFDTETMIATVYQYAVNEQGKKYIEDGAAAKREPIVISIDALPTGKEWDMTLAHLEYVRAKAVAR